jgi:hypothetical protein
MLSKKSKSRNARFFRPSGNHPKTRTGFATTRCQRTLHRENENPATPFGRKLLPSLYGLENFRGSPEKDFFDSIDPTETFALGGLMSYPKVRFCFGPCTLRKAFNGG